MNAFQVRSQVGGGPLACALAGILSCRPSAERLFIDLTGTGFFPNWEPVRTDSEGISQSLGIVFRIRPSQWGLGRA